MSMFAHVNEVAILVSAILAVAISSVWYAPVLFSLVWRHIGGIVPIQDTVPTPLLVRNLCVRILIQCVFFYILSVMLYRIQGLTVTLHEFSISIVLLIGLQLFSSVALEKKSLSYAFITMGYVAVITWGGLAVITYWPW